jgi:hypothetical protein
MGVPVPFYAVGCSTWMVLDFSYSTYCVAAPQWMEGRYLGLGLGLDLALEGGVWCLLGRSMGFWGVVVRSFCWFFCLSPRLTRGRRFRSGGGGGYVSGVFCRCRFYSVDLDLVDLMLRSGVATVGLCGATCHVMPCHARVMLWLTVGCAGCVVGWWCICLCSAMSVRVWQPAPLGTGYV